MGKKGKGAGGIGFEQQCEGLQGLWAESDRRQKKWLVVANKATRHTKANPRSYTLTKGDAGELVWGLGGQYVLDPAFRPGTALAQWRKGSASGEVVFSWDYLGAAPEDDGESPKPKAKAEGKAKVNDWSYWDNWQDTEQEKRIDPQDGLAYTWEDIKAFYAGRGGVYTLNATKAYWATLALAKPAKFQPPEKRIDHADGKAYTWEELRAFYSADYTKKATEAYWAGCEVAEQRGGEPTFKAKGAAKTKVKAKAKEFVKDLQ